MWLCIFDGPIYSIGQLVYWLSGKDMAFSFPLYGVKAPTIWRLTENLTTTKKDRPLCLHVFLHWWWTVCIAAKMRSKKKWWNSLWSLDPAVGYWLCYSWAGKAWGYRWGRVSLWLCMAECHVRPVTVKIGGFTPSRQADMIWGKALYKILRLFFGISKILIQDWF